MSGGPIGCPIYGAIIEAIPLNSSLDIVYTGYANENGFYETGDYNHLASGVYIYKLVTPN